MRRLPGALFAGCGFVLLGFQGCASPVASVGEDGAAVRLVERFIEGKEISVGILDGKPLGAVEIVPKRGFYDFQNKYTSGRTEYHLPARLSPERYRSALRLATLAHEALGCL